MSKLRFVWGLLAVTACGPDRHRVEDPGFAAKVGAEHELIPAPSMEMAQSRELATSSSSAFKAPAYLAVSPNGCLLAVADEMDRAIHLFGSGNNYRGAVRYGGKRPNGVGSLGWIAFLSDAVLAATEMGSGRVVTRALDGTTLDFWEMGVAIPPGALSVPQIGIGVRGSILEGWLLLEFATPSRDWPDSTPVAWLSRNHAPFAAIGSLNSGPGNYLTGAYNYGWVRTYRDTVWLARAAEGTLMAFSIPDSGGRIRFPSRTLALPHYFRPAIPFEVELPTGGAHQVDMQLTAFDISAEGDFILGQTISYPASMAELYRPRSAIVVMSPDGRRRWASRVNGEILAVAATRNAVHAIVRSGQGLSSVVRTFPYPWHTPGREGCPDLREPSTRKGVQWTSSLSGISH